MLNQYLSQTQSLLDDAGAVEYTTANLITYINDGRQQIAGASESLRQMATLALSGTTRSYQLSAATIPNAASLGLASVLDVRKVVLSGGFELEMRTWEYYLSFFFPVAQSGHVTAASVLQPGLNGTIWFFPTPLGNDVVWLDAVCSPIPLVNDTTIEALQYPWTEAVQYYAAYLALLNAQRRTDADAMFARYQTFEIRATQMTTPTRLPRNYAGGRGARVAGQNMSITSPTQAGTPQGGG